MPKKSFSDVFHDVPIIQKGLKNKWYNFFMTAFNPHGSTRKRANFSGFGIKNFFSDILAS